MKDPNEAKPIVHLSSSFMCHVCEYMESYIFLYDFGHMKQTMKKKDKDIMYASTLPVQLPGRSILTPLRPGERYPKPFPPSLSLSKRVRI